MTRGRLAAGLRRLRRDRRGAAIVEIAFAFPLLMTLYLGSYVLSDMIGCKRKVTIAARELTDVTSRYVALQSADVTTIMAAVAQEMVPYSAGSAMVRISEIQVCPGGATAQVIWSRANANGTARTAGSLVSLPASMFASGSPMVPATSCNSGAYFVYGEVSYPYTPVIVFGSATTTTLYDSSLLSPRASTSIGLS